MNTVRNKTTKGRINFAQHTLKQHREIAHLTRQLWDTRCVAFVLGALCLYLLIKDLTA